MMIKKTYYDLDDIDTPSFQAKKSLGQHFLSDPNILKRITNTAEITANDVVLEVGPGPGGLTRALMASPLKKLIVIEKDPQFIENLKVIAERNPGRMEIIHGDALTISLESLGQGPLKIVANLPYNVGTALMLNWLQEKEFLTNMTIMLQKEVIDRIIARPSHKVYGRLSIITQFLADTKKLFDVPPHAFRPSPKVMSSVINITPLREPRYNTDINSLEKITALAFNQRRKMLRSSLKDMNLDWEMLKETAQILDTHRPENLTVQQFCVLAGFL